jgi:hypothetical protein
MQGRAKGNTITENLHMSHLIENRDGEIYLYSQQSKVRIDKHDGTGPKRRFGIVGISFNKMILWEKQNSRRPDAGHPS